MRRLAHRVYVVTNKNKLLGGTLALLIATQLCFGIFSVVWVALRPREFPDRLFVRVQTYRLLVQPLPEINLDAFKFCAFKRWRLGELIHYNLTTFFGTPSPSNLYHYFTREI